MKKIIVLFIMAVALIFPAISLAQGLGDAGKNLGTFNTGGLSGDLGGTAQTAVKAGFGLIGTVFFILAVYGGIVWIKATGREEEVKRAKNIIMSSVIGLVVILASYAITNFVMGRLAAGG